MTRLLNRLMVWRTVGATTSAFLLSACVVEQNSPEICDPPVAKRYAKCTPQTAPVTAPAGAVSGIDY